MGGRGGRALLDGPLLWMHSDWVCMLHRFSCRAPQAARHTVCVHVFILEVAWRLLSQPDVPIRLSGIEHDVVHGGGTRFARKCFPARSGRKSRQGNSNVNFKASTFCLGGNWVGGGQATF
jgi:hypothetical protein